MGTSDNRIQVSVDARVAAYWAGFLGCAPEQLTTAGTWVAPHAGLAGYSGVYLFRRGKSCVVSAPPSLLKLVTATLGGKAAASTFDVALLKRLFGADVERVVGPAWQGYLLRDAFTPAKMTGARALATEDAPALDRLAAACGTEAWGHSGIGEIGGEKQVVFGLFVGTELVAAGMGEPRGETLLHTGIVTHPAYRGRGYGGAVVSAIASYGLDAGLVPWYQTLAANTSSVAIARALGFTQYAETLAVRLRRATDTAR
jgi:GNAT superfamily N-acetyltransferase